MPQVTNSMACAWIEAATDLGIRVVHPFTFTTRLGIVATTIGVYLPDFGGAAGTLLTCRFDADEVYEAAEETDYFRSALNPRHYEPYRRATFIEALNDWGWFGPANAAPAWFAGCLRCHGGRNEAHPGVARHNTEGLL
jgi:hypothetical protein